MMIYLGVKKAQKTGFLLNLFTYGAAAYLAQANADYYKSIIVFQGAEADWGEMKYAPTIELAKQKK